jgi:hypothetical protein
MVQCIFRDKQIGTIKYVWMAIGWMALNLVVHDVNLELTKESIVMLDHLPRV